MTNSIRDERHMALDREALEDIYNRVPIWFQNGALSAYGLHTRLTRYNKTFFGNSTRFASGIRGAPSRPSPIVTGASANSSSIARIPSHITAACSVI
jgi:hypothetical protein